MADDAQLLRQYVETRSEPAFAELVQRYLALVYHAAVRQLGPNQHLAEDVTQSVFILLAEKSRSLLGHPSLAGWLHTTTHYKVARMLRTERRRQLRERAVFAMSGSRQEPPAEEWEQIRPVLDQVLLDLNEADREVVLLRYFANLPFAEIGARLELTEKTAHKRLERALEKLRERLARRGVKSSAVALATLLGHQAALSAPAGLASAVTSAVIASSLQTAVTLGGMTLMSTKTTIGIAALAVALVSGIATYESIAKRDAAEKLADTEREVASLRVKLAAEEARIAAERAAVAARQPAKPAVAPVPAAAQPPGKPVPSMADRLEEGRALLRANPALRQSLVAYYKATLRDQYADLLATLQLNDDDTEKFLTVLMNGSAHLFGQYVLSPGDQMPAGGEMTRQLKELLGPGFQPYRDFSLTMPARDLANELTRSLYYTPSPLAPPQIEQFKQVVLQTLADPSLGPRYTGQVWASIPIPVWDQMLARTAGTLSEPQRAALNDLYQQALFLRAQSQALAAYNKNK